MTEPEYYPSDVDKLKRSQRRFRIAMTVVAVAIVLIIYAVLCVEVVR